MASNGKPAQTSRLSLFVVVSFLVVVFMIFSCCSTLRPFASFRQGVAWDRNDFRDLDNH
jgi:hypothetical protein